jgi:hypothetical protein
MKSFILKIIFAFTIVLFCFSVSAQDKFEVVHHYKRFKVDLGMGYARPQGKGNKAGVLLYIEPKYNIVDKFTVGLKTEATAMARGYVDVNNSQVTGKAGLGLSFLATGDYYFNNRLARPFAGAGAGIYNLISFQATTSNGGSISIPSTTKFGTMIRAGVEVWHVRAAIEYNFVPKTGLITNNYLGIKIGIVLGGGLYESIYDN